MLNKVAMAAVFALLPITQASAVILTKQIDITAINFAALNGPQVAAPYSPLSASFLLTIDTAKRGTFTTIQAINQPLPTNVPLAFSYDGAYLIIGGNDDVLGVGGVDYATNGRVDFSTYIYNAFGLLGPTPVAIGFEYGIGGTDFFTRTVTVRVSDAAVVPEPTSWAMMVGGFGLVGSALRRRKIAVSFA